MNEYWLFYGSSFYEPSSGLGDLKARRNSRAEALSAMVVDMDEENEDLFWAKVYEVTQDDETLVAEFSDGAWSLY